MAEEVPLHLQYSLTLRGVGVASATASIANSDADENPYTFLIVGRGSDSSTAPTLDEPGTVGQYTSLTQNGSEHLAISYYDATNDDLKLWVDDGFGSGTAGDELRNGCEIRTIDTAGDVGRDTSITTNAAGQLAVAYQDYTNRDLESLD